MPQKKIRDRCKKQKQQKEETAMQRLIDFEPVQKQI